MLDFAWLYVKDGELIVPSDHHLTNNDIDNLFKFLKENKTIYHLKLVDQWIDEKNASTIAEFLRTNYTLTELILAKCKMDAKTIRIIADALARNTSLLRLDLNGNGVGDGGAEHLALSLKTNSSLVILNLDNCQIGNKGARYLASVLRKNRTLYSLVLTGNPFSLPEVSVYFLNAIPENKAINHIQLAEDEREHQRSLNELLEKNNLARSKLELAIVNKQYKDALNLLNEFVNFYTCSYLLDIGNVLAATAYTSYDASTIGVVELVINYMKARGLNLLPPHSRKSLLQAFDNEYLSKLLPRLNKKNAIDVDYNFITLKELNPDFILDKFAYATDLTEITICYYPLNENQIKKIIHLINNNPELHTLNLSYCFISDELVKSLFSSLARHSSLTTLILAGNQFTNKSVPLILTLTKQHRLTHLDISANAFSQKEIFNILINQLQHPFIQGTIIEFHGNGQKIKAEPLLEDWYELVIALSNNSQLISINITHDPERLDERLSILLVHFYAARNLHLYKQEISSLKNLYFDILVTLIDVLPGFLLAGHLCHEALVFCEEHPDSEFNFSKSLCQVLLIKHQQAYDNDEGCLSLYKLSQCAFEQHKYEEALNYITQSMRYKPRLIDAYKLRGKIFAEMRQFAAAAADYRFIVQHLAVSDPDSIKYLNYLEKKVIPDELRTNAANAMIDLAINGIRDKEYIYLSAMSNSPLKMKSDERDLLIEALKDLLEQHTDIVQLSAEQYTFLIQHIALLLRKHNFLIEKKSSIFSRYLAINPEIHKKATEELDKEFINAISAALDLIPPTFPNPLPSAPPLSLPNSREVSRTNSFSLLFPRPSAPPLSEPVSGNVSPRRNTVSYSQVRLDEVSRKLEPFK